MCRRLKDNRWFVGLASAAVLENQLVSWLREVMRCVEGLKTTGSIYLVWEVQMFFRLSVVQQKQEGRVCRRLKDELFIC